MVNNELTHHGILGMKWGVRRTEAQLARARGKTNSEDHETAKALKKKKVSELSNAELRKLNERKQLENQYSQLNQSSFKKGVAFVATATAIMGTALSFYNTSNNTIKMGKDVSNKLVDRLGDMVMNDLKKHING